MNCNKTTIIFITFFCCMFFSIVHLSAQQNFDVKPKYNTVMVPVKSKVQAYNAKLSPSSALKKAEADIDSLNNLVLQYKTDYDKLVETDKNKDAAIDEMEQKMLKLQNAKGELERKLSSYQGENLKLDQSNRILIIFNAVVGILLLTTLIWFLRNIGRKKTSNYNKAFSSIEVSSTADNTIPDVKKNNHHYFENKLEQLEKLGKLKEKGILNEEEFSRQKQQILDSNS